MIDPELIIETHALSKAYGEVTALSGVDLAVPAGIVLGLLGPNGAGKTTTVNLLSTLQRPSGGRAIVGGFDVVDDAAHVRAMIGLTGQYAAVDEHLDGTENLTLFGELLGLNRRQAKIRAAELLRRFGLVDAAGRRAGTYSGGMRRRLDLAASLVGRPQVVFLDEPTTGLDPRSRLQLWDVVREIVNDGTTVLLTTQYLEEADELADTIVVIDAGTVVARGTADELKQQIGGQVLTLRFAGLAELDRAVTSLNGIGLALSADHASLTATVTVADARTVTTTLRMLDDAAVAIERVEVMSPTLDDAFLAITGAGTDHIDPAA